jgi:hypothetical protein
LLQKKIFHLDFFHEFFSHKIFFSINNKKLKKKKIFTTKTAISHIEEPRDLKLVKEACPGVSIVKIPGIFIGKLCSAFNFSVCFFKVALGIKVAPIC